MTTLSASTAIQDVLDQLRAHPRLRRQIVHVETLPARPARYASFPAELDSTLVQALRARGIEQLYTHQAEAVAAHLRGENVVVVTPTASGKTLCYNVPVLERLIRNPSARALYLFPTKALGHDQYGNLYDLSRALNREIKVYTFDGDTPTSARAAIRAAGQVVLTNPDMLHAGILPHHTKWIRLFENLETVVIDEMHHYGGVFGSHVANVMRRLKRLCAFYGSRPTFVCCSATIANPGPMAERLVEAPFRVIDANGAPRGERVFIFYNPPVVHAELGIRASSINEARRLAMRFLEREVQTIVFARSRNRVEILANYLKRGQARLHRDPGRIAAYRGGYLPQERRRIEQGIKRGDVLGVVSTNALELGIDIGALQVAILTGYPGTIASTWQQAGRAGRQLQTAVTILVADSSPLNQYLMAHPEFFFGSTPEEGILNPDNVVILASHLMCALHELPMEEGEPFGARPPTALVDNLVEKNIARRSEGRVYWSAEAYPAEGVPLRTATPENFIVHNTSDEGRALAEVDFDSAQLLIHEQAIYLHQGRTYYVDKLDWNRRRAYVREIEADYYTEAIAKSDLKVLHVDHVEPDPMGPGGEAFAPLEARCFGAVRVTTIVPKFKKVKFETHESIGYGDINLEENEIQTESAWWTFRPETEAWLRGQPTLSERLEMGGALHGLAWLLHNVVAFHVMSDPRDLATLPMVRAPHDGRPTIYLYDRSRGGIGLARRAFGLDRQIWRAALEIVERCPCAAGCPSCVGPTAGASPLEKEAARRLLAAMVG